MVIMTGANISGGTVCEYKDNSRRKLHQLVSQEKIGSVTRTNKTATEYISRCPATIHVTEFHGNQGKVSLEDLHRVANYMK